VEFLQKPNIAVLTNMPVDPTSVGAISYLLDQRYDFPFTAINTTDLPDLQIKDYNVIILPDTYSSGGGFQKWLGDDGVTQLKTWVENGGTLIALAGAASFLTENGTMTDVKRIKRFLKDSTESAPEKDPEKKEDSHDEQPSEAPDTVPGSIARVHLNLKNFLTFGYQQEEIPVFVASSNVFLPEEDMKPAAAYAEADRLKIAGIFWDITRKRLEKKAYATEETMGEGHVILFAEDPTFRAAWEVLDKLFMNGILFGPSM
jgi:hypothetical protein